MEKLLQEISLFGDIEHQRSLQDCTTLRIGGIADTMFYPYDLESAYEAFKILENSDVNKAIIGNGSNLLVSDKPYHGIIIRLSKYLNQYHFEDDYLIADAGCSIISLAFAAAKEGLSGLEFAAGIPASLGGTIYMNAGAYKECMGDVVESVLVYHDQQLHWIDNDQCAFGYRQSVFQAHKEWIILGAKIKLKKTDSNEIMELMDSRRARRFASQPLELPSAGSVFRNPKEMFAWQAIDQVGLRGYRINDAMVSEKHPNFIVNVGNAKASDFYELVQLIQRKVKDELNVDLLMEVERFNW